MDSDGYLYINNPNHHRSNSNGIVYVHLIEIEKSVGRRLKKREVAHHEDRDKTNNRHDNLIVFKTQANHARYHKTNIKIKTEDGSYISPRLKKVCKKCNSKFIKHKKQKFCSPECSAVASRKVERPTKKELINLLKENNFLKVGKQFNVSDNAIRKWCKAYGLSTKSERYKQ